MPSRPPPLSLSLLQPCRVMGHTRKFGSSNYVPRSCAHGSGVRENLTSKSSTSLTMIVYPSSPRDPEPPEHPWTAPHCHSSSSRVERPRQERDTRSHESLRIDGRPLGRESKERSNKPIPEYQHLTRALRTLHRLMQEPSTYRPQKLTPTINELLATERNYVHRLRTLKRVGALLPVLLRECTIDGLWR